MISKLRWACETWARAGGRRGRLVRRFIRSEKEGTEGGKGEGGGTLKQQIGTFAACII